MSKATRVSQQDHGAEGSAGAGSPAISISQNDRMGACPGREGQLRDVLVLVRAQLVLAIKASPLSRYHIAAQASELLGRDLSKDMLDKYCAESAEAYRIPVDVLTAVCLVLGTGSPFAPAVDPLGCVLVCLEKGTGRESVDHRQDLNRIVQRIGRAADELEEDLKGDNSLDAGERVRYDAKLVALQVEVATAREHVRRGA